MQLSAFFPTRDIGCDPAKVRDWAQAAEDLGYVGIEVPDHVLGAGTESRPDWKPTYAYTDPFHETFVTQGFLAAYTRSIGLVQDRARRSSLSDVLRRAFCHRPGTLRPAGGPEGFD